MQKKLKSISWTPHLKQNGGQTPRNPKKDPP